MSKLVEEHKRDDLVVLAVNVWDEDEETLEAFVREQRLKHRVLLEGADTAERYGCGTNVPVALWIDRAGVVVYTQWGFGSAASLERKTNKLVAGGG